MNKADVKAVTARKQYIKRSIRSNLKREKKLIMKQQALKKKTLELILLYRFILEQP